MVQPLKTTLFTWLGSCLLLSSSCTVFYKTSDIDAKISASIQSANENCNGVLGQITTFENDYKNLKCAAESSPFSDAIISMNEIDRSKLHMQTVQADIRKLYMDFKAYTDGKDKIASNTTEWKQFKTTKKRLKLKFKELQSTGEKTVQKAEEFNAFVSEKIVPIVQKIDVTTYTKNFEESQKSFKVSQKDLDEKIAALENDLFALKDKMGRLYKDKYDLLENDLTAIKAQRNELKSVYAQLVSIIDSFKQKMKGKATVYSCSAEWVIVKDTEKSFAELQESCAQIQVTILDFYAHMQLVMAEIK